MCGFRQIVRAAILSSILFLAFFQPLYAEWPEAGVQLTNRNIQTTYYEPDSSGGIWVIYEDYEFLSPRPMVQHIDAEGNKLLGPEGMFILEDTTAFGYIYGIQPLSDGGAFAVYDIYEENYVHAQRFSATGEKLLDEESTKVSTNDDFSAFRGFITSNVCGDGADGFWVVFTQALSFDLYYAGMNSDGTVKTGLEFVTTEKDDYGAICEDGNGGFYLLTNCALNETNESLFYNHFDEEGIPVYTGRGIRVFSGMTYSLNSVRALPHPEGGVIVTGRKSDGVAWYQRIAGNDTFVWGDEGIYYMVDASRFTFSPAITSDGSVVFASVASSAYDYRIRFGWITSSGVEKVPFLDNVIMHGDPSYLYGYPAIYNLRFEGQDVPLLFLLRSPMSDTTGLVYRSTAHRIDETGTTDLWAADPHRVGPLPQNSTPLSIHTHSISDGSMLFVFRYLHPTTGHMCYNFYKPDFTGSLGVVPEDGLGNTALPSQIEIVSTYPNPFNSSVTITLHLPTARLFNIEVYDIMGRLVDVLRRESAQSGEVQIIWAPDSSVASGVYFLRVKQDNQISRVRKTVLLR